MGVVTNTGLSPNPITALNTLLFISALTLGKTRQSRAHSVNNYWGP